MDSWPLPLSEITPDVNVKIRLLFSFLFLFSLLQLLFLLFGCGFWFLFSLFSMWLTLTWILLIFVSCHSFCFWFCFFHLLSYYIPIFLPNKDETTLGLRGAMPPPPHPQTFEKKFPSKYISIKNILLALKLIYLAPLSQTIYKLTHETKMKKIIKSSLV